MTRLLSLPSRLVPLAVLILAGASLPVFAKTTTEGGYEVTRSQEVTNAAAGWVGKKTTDREYRTGTTEATKGHSSDFVLTLGGFVRECPTAEGIVRGDFEFLVVGNDVTTVDGETVRKHYEKRMIGEFEGHVRDDATLDYVDGTVTLRRETGAAPERFTVRFRPGTAGQPDWAAMKADVQQSGDLSVAVLELFAGPTFQEAQVAWSKPGKCVAIDFSPASETQTAEANQAIEVNATVKTKDGGVPVAEGSYRAQTINGKGRVAPHNGDILEGGYTLTYTAASEPKRGDGIDTLSISRAGIGYELWKIIEAVTYEGSFTQTDTMAVAGAVYSMSAGQTFTISGKLTWTPDTSGTARESAFPGTSSAFYVPTAGTISVDIRDNGTSAAGTCEATGAEDFPLAGMPPQALRYFSLEIAEDRRYRIVLGMEGRYLMTRIKGSCRVAGMKMPRDEVSNAAAIKIGYQSGVLGDDGQIEGRVDPPIVMGPSTVNGSWSFRRSAPRAR